MTVIRLEFEIDSDVHPELHAMLSTIASLSARGERMRQLAATGLVWERTRIESLPPLPMPAASRPAGVRALVTAPVAAAIAKASPKKRPVSSAMRSSFFDLAMNPARGDSAVPVDPLALREFEDEIERVVRELPELFDVLEPGDYAPVPAPVARKPAAAPTAPKVKPAVPVLAEVDLAAAAAPVLSETLSAGPHLAEVDLADELPPRPVLVEAAESVATATADGPTEIAPAEAETPPAAPKRTRLMRMKDKGLFKNE